MQLAGGITLNVNTPQQTPRLDKAIETGSGALCRAQLMPLAPEMLYTHPVRCLPRQCLPLRRGHVRCRCPICHSEIRPVLLAVLARVGGREIFSLRWMTLYCCITGP